MQDHTPFFQDRNLAPVFPSRAQQHQMEGIRGFYEHLITEFQRSPTDPLHLVLLLKDIRRTLKAFGT